jgi:hypothetical protein
MLTYRTMLRTVVKSFNSGLSFAEDIINPYIHLSVNTNWGTHDWSELEKAKRKNSPELGLIFAWKLLEKEAKNKGYRNGYGKSQTSFIETVIKKLKLSDKENKRLDDIRKERNLFTHDIAEKTIFTWSDVEFIIGVAYKMNVV